MVRELSKRPLWYQLFIASNISVPVYYGVWLVMWLIKGVFKCV
jgi:hypothetical protein